MLKIGRKRSVVALSFLATVCLGSAAYAEVPHTFAPGQPARAVEVNENFAALLAKLDELEQRVESLSNTGLSGLLIHDASGAVVGPLLGSSRDSLVTERMIRGQLWRVWITRDGLSSDRFLFQFGVYEAENCSGEPHFDPVVFERSSYGDDLWAAMLPEGFDPSLGQLFALPRPGVSPSYVYARSYFDRSLGCINSEGDRLAFGLNDLELIDPVEGLSPPFVIPVFDP